MTETRIISRYGRDLTGTQGAHEVYDQYDSAWVIKPADRGEFGVKGSVTEYIAGRLAYELGLDVPQHIVAKLPVELITLHPKLGGFAPGEVLAVAYSNGMDLSHARRFPQAIQGLLGLSKFTNRQTAIGIIVTDTWLANTDRGIGAAVAKFGPQLRTSNEGNVYLRQVVGVDNTWDLQAIDFGYAFLKSRWGRGQPTEWPPVLWGVMRFFFEVDLLTKSVLDHTAEVTFWLHKLNSMNIEVVLFDIVSELPTAWQRSCIPSLVIDDFNDLLRRLRTTAADLPTRLTEYDEAAARYLS